MARAKIAYFSLPHRSYVNPTLPIVSVLVRRGFKLTYVTADRFSGEVSALGASIALCPRFDLAGIFKEWDEVADPFEHPFCRMATNILARFGQLFSDNRPDLIIYDAVSFAGRILATKWNIPAVCMGPDFALDRDAFTLQVPNPAFRQHCLDSSARADRFLQRHGVDSSGFIFHREGLNVYLLPKMLQLKGDVFGPEMFYAGRCIAERRTFGEWKAPDNGRPLVLVTTSTSFLEGPEHFKMCIEALSDLQWNVILSVGDGVDSALLDPLPPNVSVVQHVSHLKILPHASLLVCQGGSATVSEAAYNGVPMVVTTRGSLELEWMGENIVNLGIGIHLKNAEMTAEAIRGAALAVSHDVAMHQRVEEMRRVVCREPGAEEVVNRIEEYLEAVLCR
jgi:MGT family glycosyltransferase